MPAVNYPDESAEEVRPVNDKSVKAGIQPVQSADDEIRSRTLGSASSSDDSVSAAKVDINHCPDLMLS
jgi:hypothetical protein